MSVKDQLIFSNIEQHQNEIYVLLHELEVEVPQHTHYQGHILLVLDGVAAVSLDSHEYYIPFGYFVWIPPKVSHRISFEGSRVKFLNIYFPKDAQIPDFYSKVGAYPIPSILHHAFELVTDKTASYSSVDWQYELLMTLYHILPNILSISDFQLRLPTSDHPIIRKITEIIKQKYDTDITAQSLSQEVGLSVRTLNRYLHNELGISFIQYLRTYRIIIAIKQIAEGESVTNAAYNVGYDSLTAFSNTFYQLTGSRPSQFFCRLAEKSK